MFMINYKKNKVGLIQNNFWCHDAHKYKLISIIYFEEQAWN